MPDTVFHLRPVETKAGRLALVTIDNGEDWTKPPSLGRSAFESGVGFYSHGNFVHGDFDPVLGKREWVGP